MRISLILAAAAAAIAFPAVASATECAYSPRESWKSIAEVTAKVTAMGYDVRKVEIDDNCYEVDGVGKNGVRWEFHLHPVSFDVVKSEIDD